MFARRRRVMDTALRLAYEQGVAAGMVVTLRLCLGEDLFEAHPYTGEVPDELRTWALDAIGRLTERYGVEEVISARSKRD